MIQLLRIYNSQKHVFILSAFVILSSCSGLGFYKQKSNHTTTHITYDLFSTDNKKTIPEAIIIDRVKPFNIDKQSELSELQQLENWIALNCEDLNNSWQSCINSLSIVKQFNLSNETQINNLTNIEFKHFFLAAYRQNQAELLLNKYNDRKYKIEAAHYLIEAKQLLEKNKDNHLAKFRSLLIHIIELQLNNMVQQDNFLTVLISKPVFLEKNNTNIEYSIINWTANALTLNDNQLKKIRKKNPTLKSNACLINLETAIKYQKRLNKKWATLDLSKRDDALMEAKFECANFPFRFYLFDQVFLIWPEVQWPFLNINPSTQTHPILIQSYLFNDQTNIQHQQLETQYINQNPLDIFTHYHLALKDSFISFDNPCFKLNPRYINCYQLLSSSKNIEQLNNREFVINQLAYVFPYELLLQQLRLRLDSLNSELHIQLNEREIVEASFNSLFIEQLNASNFSLRELKLLYAYYAIFNLSSDFLNEKNTEIITDFFFTQEGYQLKWQLSLIVQDILGFIQTSNFVDPESKKSP